MSRPQLILILIVGLFTLTAATDTDADPEPPTKEEFEKVFDQHEELKKMFTTLFYASHLFYRPSSDWVDRSWKPLPVQCVVQLMDDGIGQIHRTCVEILKPFSRKDILLAYRCFKGEKLDLDLLDPYNYELHTAKIDSIADNPSPSLVNAFSIFFTPQQRTGSCNIRTIQDMDMDVILRRAKENTERSNYLASATEPGTKPLDKETYEMAFFNLRYPTQIHFKTQPYLTYVFQRNLKTLSTELEPIRECVVRLTMEGFGTVEKFCWDMLHFYQHLNEKLVNVVLPYRCFWINDTMEYDLHVVPIEDVFKTTDVTGEREQYLIQFTPLNLTTTNCTPIYENTYRASRNVDPEAEHRQYLQSLSKERFEELFRVTGLSGSEYIKSMAHIYSPGHHATEKILEPLPECNVMLFRGEKALILNEDCATILGIQGLFTPLSEQKNVLLAYRCYLLYNPLEYELHTVNIEKMAEEEEDSGEVFIYFKRNQSEYCLPVWKEDLPRGERRPLVKRTVDEWPTVGREEL